MEKENTPSVCISWMGCCSNSCKKDSKQIVNLNLRYFDVKFRLFEKYILSLISIIKNIHNLNTIILRRLIKIN